MPSQEEKTEVQRNAVALMLHALRSPDRGTELFVQLGYLDLIPVVMLLAEIAAQLTVREHGEEAAVQRLEQQLIDLARGPE